MKELKTALAIVGFIFSGFVIGATASHEASKEENHAVKTITVTVTETPEPVVITSTPEPVVTTDLPEECKKLTTVVERVYASVSEVSSTMGEQEKIASFAREAINGSNYKSLGDVMRDQADLEDTLITAYQHLAEDQYNLDRALEACKEDMS